MRILTQLYKVRELSGEEVISLRKKRRKRRHAGVALCAILFWEVGCGQVNIPRTSGLLENQVRESSIKFAPADDGPKKVAEASLPAIERRSPEIETRLGSGVCLRDDGLQSTRRMINVSENSYGKRQNEPAIQPTVFQQLVEGSQQRAEDDELLESPAQFGHVLNESRLETFTEDDLATQLPLAYQRLQNPSTFYATENELPRRKTASQRLQEMIMETERLNSQLNTADERIKVLETELAHSFQSMVLANQRVESANKQILRLKSMIGQQSLEISTLRTAIQENESAALRRIQQLIDSVRQETLPNANSASTNTADANTADAIIEDANFPMQLPPPSGKATGSEK